MHSVFIYFKVPAVKRSRAAIAINALGAAIATRTGARFRSGRRADRKVMTDEPDSLDTWLEHYQCIDDSNAQAVLAELNEIEASHPLLALIEGGLEGRHLEHFVDTTTCV